MISTISWAVIALGVLCIAFSVFSFFRNDGYAVYKDLKSTNRVQIEQTTDSVAKGIYYENQLDEADPPEKKSIFPNPLKFRRAEAVLAKDDTSILYEEEKKTERKKPVFRREKKNVSNTEFLKQDPTSKEDAHSVDEIDTKTGTGVLVQDSKPEAQKPPTGTQLLADAIRETQTGKRSPGKGEPKDNENVRKNGTEPLQVNHNVESDVPPKGTEPLKIGGTEPLQSINNGTQPIQSANNGTQPLQPSSGTQPLTFDQIQFDERTGLVSISGTEPLGEGEKT